MAVSYLPKTVTKEDLLHAVQNRLMQCTKMFWDPDTTVQQMYEDLSCSIFSGDPEYDFPDKVKAEQDFAICYQYKDGNCSFMIDGIEVEVQDLRSMRESPRVGKELYADVCVLTISYTEEDGMYMYHVVPDAWLYGSTSDDFNEGMPVHQEFIDAARDYIKINHITKEMQEVQN